jgi:homoserine kinase
VEAKMAALKTERAELVQRLASDELSEPERAKTQQKLDKVEAKMSAGGNALPNKRAKLQKLIAAGVLQVR